MKTPKNDGMVVIDRSIEREIERSRERERERQREREREREKKKKKKKKNLIIIQRNESDSNNIMQMHALTALTSCI